VSAAGLYLVLRQRFYKGPFTEAACVNASFVLRIGGSHSCSPSQSHGTDFARSSRQRLSTLALRFSIFHAWGVVPSFRYSLCPGNSGASPFCKDFCRAHCSSVSPSGLWRRVHHGDCLFFAYGFRLSRIDRAVAIISESPSACRDCWDHLASSGRSPLPVPPFWSCVCACE